MSVFPNALVFISFSVISLLVFHVFMCSNMESFSHLDCIITTAFSFVNPQHLTNFSGQNCTYSIRTYARQTSRSGHLKKNLVFFCACPAITHKPAKKEQVFFSQKICPCSAITYNFYPLSARIFSATCEIPVPQVHIPF